MTPKQIARLWHGQAQPSVFTAEVGRYPSVQRACAYPLVEGGFMVIVWKPVDKYALGAPTERCIRAGGRCRARTLHGAAKETVRQLLAISK